MEKTYSEVTKRSAATRKKKMGAVAFKKHMRGLALKRHQKCMCGHSYDVHDGACCADICQCRVFHGVIKKVDN